MERGVLVPDEVTINMVIEWIDATKGSGGFILDGFPRTLAQAEALDAALAEADGIDRILYINVSEQELASRLGGRLVCRGCQTIYHASSSPPRKAGECDRCGGEVHQRDDDRPAAVEKRIQVYARETEPLVDYYRRAGTLTEVDGDRSIEEVGVALEDAVG
jgi:adenylate kinase